MCGAVQPDSMQAIQAEYWQRINEIWKRYDCNPAKSLISLGLQAPTFLCFFAGLRHLAAAKVCPCCLGRCGSSSVKTCPVLVVNQCPSPDNSMCRCHP
jgi:hypothetical protein